MIKSIGVFKDVDNSIKCVFENEDKNIIEMTQLFNKDGIDVICVPTHHYCNLGCKMCHLTNIGSNRKMVPIDIDDFIYSLKSTLRNKKNIKRTNNRKLLISFMGVGEPLLNLKLLRDVFEVESIIKKELDYDYISYAISTMMPFDNIDELIKIVEYYEVSLKIHFSLHNPFDSKRRDLIPSSTISIKDALSILTKYNNRIKNNKKIMNIYNKFHSLDELIEIHYTLIKDVNDSNCCLKELIYLLEHYPMTIKFIRFNEVSDMKRSDKEELFVNILSRLDDVRVKRYSPPGKNIGSSCGEFTKYYYSDNTNDIDFNLWKNTYEIFE